MRLTGADILMECLLEQGVEVIFGYPGGTILNVYDSLVKYRDRIKALYKYIADHAGDGLDESELNYIRDENEKIANEMIARRQNLIDAGLLKPSDDSEKYEQKASQGGWESMGEDTGQELNGRFTALQMSCERISEGIITMVSTMAAIYTNTETGNLTLLEIRNLMITNNAFLEDILEADRRARLTVKENH